MTFSALRVPGAMVPLCKSPSKEENSSPCAAHVATPPDSQQGSLWGAPPGLVSWAGGVGAPHLPGAQRAWATLSSGLILVPVLERLRPRLPAWMANTQSTCPLSPVAPNAGTQQVLRTVQPCCCSSPWCIPYEPGFWPVVPKLPTDQLYPHLVVQVKDASPHLQTQLTLPLLWSPREAVGTAVSSGSGDGLS